MRVGLAAVGLTLLGSGAMVIANGAALAQPDGKVDGQTPSYGLVTIATSTSTAVASPSVSADVPDPIVDGRAYLVELAVGDVFRLAGSPDR